MYVYVLNLLNEEIVNAVYSGTGKPDDNGFLQTPTGASRYANDPIFAKYFFERQRSAFGNWGPPRQIRFGINLSF
jgi:hypothetical protein